jgi:AraC-like DNA-binding protein
MTAQTERSLLIDFSLPALYQRLLSGVATYQELGNRILRQIKSAQAFRQVEQVRELARLLVNVPIKEFQLIAQYYLVWCKCRESEYQTAVVERIAEQTQTYKVKALSSRGTFEWYNGNNEAALYFYGEALKASPTISEYIDLSKGIAVLKSQEGFQRSAIRDLEATLRIIRHAEPLVYYEFLNSYAVEMASAGRLIEAESASLLAVSSPFGPFYREWQDTLTDVRSRRKRRSTVTIIRAEQESEAELEAPDNLLHKAKVQAVIDFMNANFHRSIAMTDVASLVNFSDTYLSRVFKIETGITPSQYLARLRMEKASQLLTTTFLSIKEIMAAVGYNSKSYFAKQFKRHFDVTPSEYRLARLKG